ncbi:MAG: hypothetical protein IKM61_02090 [Eubacteriaceae bacterium]|nr:hypothetical protein [Eubacteriaceae bacterium]
MSKDKSSSDPIAQENKDNNIKKILVPVALTVGLLGNAASAEAVDLGGAQSSSSEIISADALNADIAPVDLSQDEEDDDEDEEKRSYKGKNLAKSSAGAGLLTSSAIMESSFGELFHPVLLSGIKFMGIFAMLSVLFMGMFKAIYPQRTLGEIINKKNIFRIFIAAAVLFMTNHICDSLSEQRNIFLELTQNGILLAVIIILWYRIFELKGKFGKVMKDLFWGKKGKWIFIALISFNILMSILHIIYSTVKTANSFTSLLIFYIISVFSVFAIYELCKGRMVEDDEYESKHTKENI